MVKGVSDYMVIEHLWSIKGVNTRCHLGLGNEIII